MSHHSFILREKLQSYVIPNAARTWEVGLTTQCVCTASISNCGKEMVLKFLCQDSKVAWEKKTLIRRKYPAHPRILQSCLVKGDYILTDKIENETDERMSCPGLVPALLTL